MIITNEIIQSYIYNDNDHIVIGYGTISSQQYNVNVESQTSLSQYNNDSDEYINNYVAASKVSLNDQFVYNSTNFHNSTDGMKQNDEVYNELITSLRELCSLIQDGSPDKKKDLLDVCKYFTNKITEIKHKITSNTSNEVGRLVSISTPTTKRRKTHGNQYDRRKK